MLLHKAVQTSPTVSHAVVATDLFCSSAKTMQVDDSTVRRVSHAANPVLGCLARYMSRGWIML